MALNAPPAVPFDRDDTFLIKKPSSDEEYLAFCLLMLARTKTSTQHLQSRQTPAINNIPSPPQQQNRTTSYKCSVCDKVFSSHQALGGHKASHSKPNGASIADKQTNAAAASPVGKIHECSICHKRFTTGQALGGHKRRHYEGPISSNSGEKIQSQSPSQSQSRGGGGFDFDLNTLPEIEDGEEEFESDVVSKKPRLLGEQGSDDHKE